MWRLAHRVICTTPGPDRILPTMIDGATLMMKCWEYTTTRVRMRNSPFVLVLLRATKARSQSYKTTNCRKRKKEEVLCSAPH